MNTIYSVIFELLKGARTVLGNIGIGVLSVRLSLVSFWYSSSCLPSGRKTASDLQLDCLCCRMLGVQAFNRNVEGVGAPWPANELVFPHLHSSKKIILELGH